MGAPSLAEDASERRDEDESGAGGAVGPAGGIQLLPCMPTRNSIPQKLRRKELRHSPAGEFELLCARLEAATQALGDRLRKTASEFDWCECVRRSSEFHVRWVHLLDEMPVAHPSYEDYLATRQVLAHLNDLRAALFDLEAAVVVELVGLKALRDRCGEWKPNLAHQEAEKQGEQLWSVCEQIGTEAHKLDYLLFTASAFDVHHDRYEAERSR